MVDLCPLILPCFLDIGCDLDVQTVYSTLCSCTLETSSFRLTQTSCRKQHAPTLGGIPCVSECSLILFPKCLSLPSPTPLAFAHPSIHAHHPFIHPRLRLLLHLSLFHLLLSASLDWHSFLRKYFNILSLVLNLQFSSLARI